MDNDAYEKVNFGQLHEAKFYEHDHNAQWDGFETRRTLVFIAKRQRVSVLDEISLFFKPFKVPIEI